MNMETTVAIFSKDLLNVLPDDPLASTLIPEHDRFWCQNPVESIIKFPAAIAFSTKYSLLFICDKKKSTVFMANLHNPVCVVPIAGRKEGISCPLGVVVRQHYIIVLNSGSTLPLKVIDRSSTLNKSRVLLQLDVEVDATQQPSEDSNSTRVKVYDVSLWTNSGTINLGHLVSLTANPSLQTLGIEDDSILYVLSFDKKRVFKLSNFTLNAELKEFTAKVELFFQYTNGQPLCLFDGDEGLSVGIHNRGIQRLSCVDQSVQTEDIVRKNPSITSVITCTDEKLVFTDAHDHTLNFFDKDRVTKSLGDTQGIRDGFSATFNSPSSLTLKRTCPCVTSTTKL